MGMDIKRLTHFITLAEEGRFVQAAARVHLSQAAFSRSIQTLEEQLGLRLVDRGPQGATLTAVGQTVLRRARILVDGSRCLERDIELLRSGGGGEITVGVAPIPAATLLPGLLQQLQLKSPRLVTRVRFGQLQALADQLDAHELDFCLGEPRLLRRNERHTSTLVARQHGGLYCRPGHPLARRHIATAADLQRYGIARISMTPELLDGVAANYGYPSGAALPLSVECDDVHALARLVAHSDVIGILPRACAACGELRLRSLDYAGASDLHADVHAIWLKDRTLSPAASLAIGLLGASV